MKLLVVLSLSLLGTAHAAKWNRHNNPLIFNNVADKKITVDFADLPLEAKIQDHRIGWSETYWPSYKGGIAFRWNSPNPQPFKYKLLTKAELMSMNESQLSELSPAELYDISQGDYSYSLTRKVLNRFSPNDLWWEGICDGWSLAASHFPEPDKTVVTNKDGIKVPFGSSDVKGLLSMHEAFNNKGRYARIGERCKANGKVEGEALPKDKYPNPPSKRDADKDECQDVNAGAFHVVITNMIGINSQGLIADVDRFNDVWNQPLTSYEAKIVGQVPVTAIDRKNGIFEKVRITMTMHYAEELTFWDAEKAAKGILGFVSKEPVLGTPAQTYEKKHYDYIVELNQAGQVIGGEWITESRPDMMWVKTRDAKFLNGKFPLAGLNQIYKPVHE